MTTSRLQSNGSIASDRGEIAELLLGDAFCVAFDRAGDALAAAMQAQQALYGEEWPETGELKVRMSLHIGAAEFRDGDYFGNSLKRAVARPR